MVVVLCFLFVYFVCLFVLLSFPLLHSGSHNAAEEKVWVSSRRVMDKEGGQSQDMSDSSVPGRRLGQVSAETGW